MLWAAYLRVSTDEQVKGTGLDVQREAITRWLPKGDSLHDFYVDDGYSGAREDRPALQKLLKDAHDGKLGGVVVYKTDRLARSIKLIVKLALDVFEGLDLAFVSVTEPYDTRTPQGRLFFTQLAGFADFERELIKERTQAGKLRRIKEGLWLTWNPPFGYRRISKGDARGKLIIEKDEAEVYRLMVKWVIEDKVGSHTIARRLNALGIPTRYVRYAKSAKIPFTQTKKDKFLWVYRTVHSILVNPIYKGESRSGNSLPIQRLISPEKWDVLRNQIKENWKNKPLRKTRQRHFLQGLLRCGRCSRRMYGKVKPRWRCPRYDCRHGLNEEIVDGKLPERCSECKRLLVKPWFNEQRIYRCWGREYRETPWPDGRCTLPSVRMEKANQIVWDTVRELAKNSRKLKEILETELSKSEVDSVLLEVERDHTARAIADKDAQIDALLTSRSLVLRPEYVQRNVDRLHKDKEALQAELSRLNEQLAQAERVKNNRSKLERVWTGVAKRIDTFTEQEKFDFLHALISKIVVNYDQKQEHFLEVKLAVDIFEQDQFPKVVQSIIASLN